MARSTMSPAAVVRHIATYAAPDMSYMAMIAAPTPDIDAAEALVMQSAMRVPFRALPRGAVQHLHEIAGKR